jgi:hypothetical protein
MCTNLIRTPQSNLLSAGGQGIGSPQAPKPVVPPPPASTLVRTATPENLELETGAQRAGALDDLQSGTLLTGRRLRAREDDLLSPFSRRRTLLGA